MVGIIGYGTYVPRLRMSRAAIYEANKWFAPGLKGKAKGHMALTNWDEDSVTMAVEACRNVIPNDDIRGSIETLFFASTTHTFADRLNAGILKEALRLSERVNAMDMGGSSGAASTSLPAAMASAKATQKNAVIVTSDARISRAASPAEMTYGDGAACLLLGSENIIADVLAHERVTVDFVEQFRQSGEDINYQWEDRWVRDEGITTFVPKAIAAALKSAGLTADQIDHFVYPSRFARIDGKIAKMAGINPDAVASNHHAAFGHLGAADTIFHMAITLEQASAGQTILVIDFSGGASATILKTTKAIEAYKPKRSLEDWSACGREEISYTKYLSIKGQLDLEKGMRGEQDRKAALSTLYRHKDAILGFVAGRCSVTGSVSFPPSRLSYDSQGALLDTQEAHPLADRGGKIMSCSAEALSYYPVPPHQYGQVDFEGGGRVAMEFTDVDPGDIEAGSDVEMVFRVKDRDDRRSFTRYFWKATPKR